MNINLVDKIIYASHSTVKSSTSNYANSPYIILINDDSLNSNDYGVRQNGDDPSVPKDTTKESRTSLNKIESSSINLNFRLKNFLFNFFFICLTLGMNYFGILVS
jgi:hypothetical protein